MSKHQPFTCPDGVGTYEIYRMYHEELESLVKHIPTIKRAQFWMSFSLNYLKHQARNPKLIRASFGYRPVNQCLSLLPPSGSHR
jgi:hypothetical protein